MLCSVKELLEFAEKNDCAIGAFNVSNLEMVMGVIKAAEDTNSPIILQIAESRLNFSPLHLMGPVMVEAAKKSKVKVAVQLDHAQTFSVIEEALKIGFSSIMYDGSHLSIEKNIENTNLIKGLTEKYHASLEAELGIIKGDEGNISQENSIYTKLEDVLKFTNLTDVTSLAIAIGNAHGVYSTTPKLNFGLLKEISSSIKTPLVLHGGSGITYSDFRNCINNGIRKINIATANFIAFVLGSNNYLNNNANPNFFELNQAVIKEIFKVTKEHIEVFNNKKSLKEIGVNTYE